MPASTKLPLLSDFLASWHGLSVAHEKLGTIVNSSTLPGVLKYFYDVCGERLTEVISYNRMRTWQELAPGDIPLVFCDEGEGVYQWALASNDRDPAVVGRYDSGSPWITELELLSGFLLQLCIFDAAMFSPYGASVSYCAGDDLTSILEDWSEYDLAPWHWPKYPTRFYQRTDAVALATPNADGYTFKCGALRADALSPLQWHVTKDWEYVNIDGSGIKM